MNRQIKSNRLNVNAGIISWYIKALKSLISILEDKENDCFYMFQGDVTYCDAVLLANELSVVFEDKEKARETLDRVREFVKKTKQFIVLLIVPKDI